MRIEAFGAAAESLLMDDATCDQILEHLATILEQVQGVRADMIDMKARLQRAELAVVDLEQDVTGLRKEVLRLDHRLDRLDERLAGLERRLDWRRTPARG
jgi:chromosome segregation ATPase